MRRFYGLICTADTFSPVAKCIRKSRHTTPLVRTTVLLFNRCRKERFMNATRKRPAKGREKRQHLVSVYMPDELVDVVDEWRLRQDGEPSRSCAIRMMLQRAIRAEAKARRD